MHVAIILLNWNNATDTISCLQSLQKIDYPSYEIIVVDNGSTDDSLKQIQSLPFEITLIQNQENLGFTGGSNIGLKKGIEKGADLLILLNNDTVVSPQFISELVNAAHNHPKAGAFGPKIYFYDEPTTIWYAGGSVDPHTGRCFHIGYGKEKDFEEEKSTDYICGCALAIRKSALEKIGYLSEDYFLIWEEIDFCYRLKKAGLTCIFVPKSKIWHKVSGSFIEGNRGPMWYYFYFRNRLLFHKRHKITKRAIPIFELVDLIRTSLHPKTTKDLRKRANASLLGIRDYYLRKFGKGSLAKFIQ